MEAPFDGLLVVIRDLPERRSFLQSIAFIALLQNKHTTLAESGENQEPMMGSCEILISAHLSAHSQGPKI